ncbi:MAG: response regulator transcription factor [Acidobacteria bacterium]|nr:response regulator transcription factor [Acidobacteriota bacterium]
MGTYKDKLRVLLIKEELKREGYDTLLENEGRFDIVGETTSVDSAVELANEQVPDMILIESFTAESRIIEAIKKLKESNPDISLVLISYPTEDKFMSEALRAGASGYIIKTHVGNEVAEAISKIENGQIYLSPLTPKSVVREFLPKRRDSEGLTERQKNILKFLVSGQTNKEIAQYFNLSVKTIDAHRANIMTKLNIHDLPGLVKYAVRSGIVNLEEL